MRKKENNCQESDKLLNTHKKELADCIHALFRHTMESLLAFLNDPQDDGTKKILFGTMTKLWWNWNDLYYIHMSDYFYLYTSKPNTIAPLPSYLRQYMHDLEVAISKFAQSTEESEYVIKGRAEIEQRNILSQIERDFDKFNKDVINQMADLLSRLQVFREMTYPEKPNEESKADIIPFKKEDN